MSNKILEMLETEYLIKCKIIPQNLLKSPEICHKVMVGHGVGHGVSHGVGHWVDHGVGYGVGHGVGLNMSKVTLRVQIKVVVNDSVTD